MTDKQLTYTYPRTWAEAISRMPAEGQDAVAIERHKAPLLHRLMKPSVALVVLAVCAVALKVQA
jgi:hypothetical protein